MYSMMDGGGDRVEGRGEEEEEGGGLGMQKAALKKFIGELTGHKNFICFTAMNIVQV